MAKAKAEFSALRVAGFAFFREDDAPAQRLGKTGTLVVKAREFDPKAKRTVAVRPMRGG